MKIEIEQEKDGFVAEIEAGNETHIVRGKTRAELSCKVQNLLTTLRSKPGVLPVDGNSNSGNIPTNTQDVSASRVPKAS